MSIKTRRSTAPKTDARQWIRKRADIIRRVDQAYHVGDRVVYSSASSSHLNGQKGTVVWTDWTECGVTVRFDRRMSGMVIEERGGNHIRNCWFCRPENLKRLEVSE